MNLLGPNTFGELQHRRGGSGDPRKRFWWLQPARGRELPDFVIRNQDRPNPEALDPAHRITMEDAGAETRLTRRRSASKSKLARVPKMMKSRELCAAFDRHQHRGVLRGNAVFRPHPSRLRDPGSLRPRPDREIGDLPLAGLRLRRPGAAEPEPVDRDQAGGSAVCRLSPVHSGSDRLLDAGRGSDPRRRLAQAPGRIRAGRKAREPDRPG